MRIARGPDTRERNGLVSETKELTLAKSVWASEFYMQAKDMGRRLSQRLAFTMYYANPLSDERGRRSHVFATVA